MTGVARSCCLLSVAFAVACGWDGTDAPALGLDESPTSTASEDETPARAEGVDADPGGGPTATEGERQRPDLSVVRLPLFGDLDAIVERRTLRVLVTFSSTFYFLDGATQRGVSYEGAKLFVDWLNTRYPDRGRPINVVFLPTTRDQVMGDLVDGYGDIAIAGLTVTDARSTTVDFSNPILSGVNELLVTGPGSPVVTTLRDLAGKSVWARPSSSYAESLRALSDDLVARGLEPIQVESANEVLEDEDLLEMVDAGLLPMIVVDSYKAGLWADIFDQIQFREDLPIATGRQIAWAVRKESPELLAAVNEFVRSHKKGTLTGNVLFNRYFRDNEWVRNSLDGPSQRRLADVVHIFEQYADEYGFDWMMLAAQGYQESGLDQSVRSRAGAVGIMQVLPSTAADPQVAIANIEVVENNIHAGAKYLRFMLTRYFGDDHLSTLNQHLFAFAAYNAGPSRIRRLREKAAASGFDPDVWFGNVEVVAAREVGREPVVYVRNIFQYYLAYRLIEVQRERKEAARSPR